MHVTLMNLDWVFIDGGVAYSFFGPHFNQCASDLSAAVLANRRRKGIVILRAMLAEPAQCLKSGVRWLL
jgi:hypothetical protein